MLKRIREMFKNEKGLTLVELLAVIVILAVIGVIAFVMIGNIIDNSKKDAQVANALQLIEAAKMHEASGETIKEGTSNGIQLKDLADKDKSGVLSEVLDPWDKKPYSDSSTKVYKVDGAYSVTLVEASGVTGQCDIKNETELDLKQEGRDICKGENEG